MIYKNLFLLLIVTIIAFSCKQKNQSSGIENHSIDITARADTLTLFGKNKISTNLYERDIAINPQGNELIYTLGDYKQNKRCLVSINKKNHNWTEPNVLNISGKYQDIEPFYANDGNRLYFASNRPIYNDTTRKDYNIWYSDKVDNTWSKPIALDSIINTKGDEFFPSLSENGNLYFTGTRENGVGREDIFKSEFINGSFTYPKPLPSEINTGVFEFNAYISPDENLIIFSSFGREDGLGGGDLYISKKDSVGNWTKAVNMGATINSKKLDYCPFIDWNEGNFYFTSERMNESDVTIKNVKQIKELSSNVKNGFGNIYKIGIDSLRI